MNLGHSYVTTTVLHIFIQLCILKKNAHGNGNFLISAKIEVVSCPEDPREWRQIFEISPVGINESVLVDLEMMCQCDCEKPGNEVRNFPNKVSILGVISLLPFMHLFFKVHLF